MLAQGRLLRERYPRLRAAVNPIVMDVTRARGIGPQRSESGSNSPVRGNLRAGAYDDGARRQERQTPMKKTSKLTLAKTTIKKLNVVKSGIKAGISATRCYISEVIGPGCGSK